MKLVVESHIQGTFLGYAPGVVHKLDDGSEWEQTSNTREYVYRERPGCRVFWNREPTEPPPRTPSASSQAAPGQRAGDPCRPRSTPTLAARCS